MDERLARKELLKAQSAVERLLNIRLRSEKELREKLQNKHFSDDIIDQTIRYYEELNLVDDRLFSKHWIRSRLKKPFGRRRIQRELINKGIDKDTLESELDKAFEEFEENEVVFHLAEHRAAKYRGLDPQKVRQRIYGYLSRRGFSPTAIFHAIKKLEL